MEEDSLRTSNGSNSGYRDVLYTIDDKGRRKWVYPEFISGKFFKSRRFVAYALMIVYLGAPWMKINGHPLILLNFPERVFIFLGIPFWATDTVLLMLVLAALALTLFFVTALFGRLWCGWACPQTVFLEFLFRPIERFFEGDANKRRKLDRAPWSLEKIIRKGLKHLTSALFASLIANTALAYFIGSERLLDLITSSPMQNPGLFSLMIFLMALMAFEFGWFREQFCTVLCPYARFQSVMLDPDSLVIGYDPGRGEPRGKKADSNAGDCVDCGLCVRVCPTGIDIRNGLQLECVNCAQCIDACDSIMEKVGRPKGLIRYDTERHLLGGKRKILRPRLAVYATLLILYAAMFTYVLATRINFDFDILREPGAAVFMRLPDGRISNQFKAKVSNKSNEAKSFHIRAEIPGLSPEEYDVVIALPDVTVQAGQITDSIPVFITLPKEKLNEGKRKIKFSLRSATGASKIKEVTILGPTE